MADKENNNPQALSTVGTIAIQIKKELSNPSIAKALLATTFKDLSEENMRQALMEGMIRGFSFQEFLKKDVYAIPFGKGYSLMTSIDFARKIGMRSGIVGKDAPIYEMSDDGKSIISCSVTVHKKIDEYVGKFTANVYFSEYSTGKNLWSSKPRTMIAKVAEMHAIRMACPEETAKQYIEEEMELEFKPSRTSEANELVEESNLTMGSIEKKDEPEIKEAKITKEDKNEPRTTEGDESDINPFAREK